MKNIHMVLLGTVLLMSSSCVNRVADFSNNGIIVNKSILPTRDTPLNGTTCMYTVQNDNGFIGAGVVIKKKTFTIYADKSFARIGDTVGYLHETYTVINDE